MSNEAQTLRNATQSKTLIDLPPDLLKSVYTKYLEWTVICTHATVNTSLYKVWRTCMKDLREVKAPEGLDSNARREMVEMLLKRAKNLRRIGYFVIDSFKLDELYKLNRWPLLESIAFPHWVTLSQNLLSSNLRLPNLKALSLRVQAEEHLRRISTEHPLRKLESLTLWSLTVQPGWTEQGDDTNDTISQALVSWSTNLKFLSLYSFPLDHCLMTTLQHLKKLTHLRLPNANLTDALCHTMAVSAPQLRELFIAGNPAVTTLQSFGEKLRKLESLDIRRTQIELKEVEDRIFSAKSECGQKRECHGEEIGECACTCGYFPRLRNLWLSKARTFHPRAPSDLREAARRTRPDCSINPRWFPEYH